MCVTGPRTEAEEASEEKRLFALNLTLAESGVLGVFGVFGVLGLDRSFPRLALFPDVSLFVLLAPTCNWTLELSVGPSKGGDMGGGNAFDESCLRIIRDFSNIEVT